MTGGAPGLGRARKRARGTTGGGPGVSLFSVWPGPGLGPGAGSAHGLN